MVFWVYFRDEQTVILLETHGIMEMHHAVCWETAVLQPEAVQNHLKLLRPPSKLEKIIGSPRKQARM